jgi:hypothetical protein
MPSGMCCPPHGGAMALRNVSMRPGIYTATLGYRIPCLDEGSSRSTPHYAHSQLTAAHILGHSTFADTLCFGAL